MGSRKEDKSKSKSKGGSKKKAAGAYVTLTLRSDSDPATSSVRNSLTGKPPGGDLYPPSPNMPSVGFLGGNGGRPHHHLSTDYVTAPLPVNQDVQLQMQGCKLRTLQAMRDKASTDVEKLWKKYEASGHPQDQAEFEKAQQGLKKIESQMKTFRQSSPNLQLQAPVPFGQFSGGHQSVPFQPPPRHRNPLAGPAMSTAPTYQNLNWICSDNDMDQPPPPLPPRTHHYPNLDTSNHHLNNHNQGHKHFNNTNQDLLTKQNSFGSSPNNNGQSNAQQQQTHHRAKSSPDPVSMQKALNSEGSKRSDSFNDLSNNSSSSSKKNSRSRSAWDSVDSNHLSPPGSPPPPYLNKFNNSSSADHESSSNNEYQNNSNVSLSSLERGLSGALPNRSSQFSAVDIIAMEEDDAVLWPNEPIVPTITGFHGPYSSLSRLLEHNAHLAVFINYVIDNRKDPSSLLFYLITALDIEEGGTKEMKRWGYEIHSTFSAPGAPLLVPNVDENIAAEIDDSLLHEVDKEEMMRRVFRKARNKAKEEINKQLEEFCNKRTAGLGSMYGPPDNQLDESLHDKNKELRIVETYLVPRVEQFSSEVDKNNEGRTFAIMIAVATVIVKLFGLRNHPNLNLILERHGSFMSKDKSMKSRFISKPKKVAHNGHHFVLQCYSSYTECNICSKLLWGIGPQGQQCVDCNLNIHKSVDTYRTHNCINDIHDVCLGTNNQKNKANDKFRRFRDRIRPEKDPKKRISKKLPDETSLWGSFGESDTAEKPLGGSGSSLKGDRRPDTLSEERIAPDGFTFEDGDSERVHDEPKKPSTAVGRSESCKERVQRKQTRERRKHSDPNLSKSNDVDLDNQRQLSDANNSGSSSNSSLSLLRSLESPSTSLELVAPSNNSSSSLRERSSETPETTVGNSSEPFKPSPGWDGDSDIEIDQDPPDWTKNVPEETLSSLDRLEKNRQEVLNELFHTERSHVRNLKVVDRLFHRPIRQQQLLPENLIQMLFANLDEMLEIHGRFNSALKKLRMEAPLIGDIGPVLLEMFDGESGDNFKRAAATFCAKQQIGLENLRDKRRKDARFNSFLTESELDSVCRRLGIKDMIPMAMQRLTKYPLLFENLCNCTASDSEEYKHIQRAVELSKDILTHVNSAKKEAEDQERLIEIQRKLDKPSFEKGIDKTDPSISEIRNLDFTKHRLIYEGPLMWRMTKSTRQKSDLQEVQAVLLDSLIVILLKQDDRYVLKIHNIFPGKSDRMMAKPIIKLNNLHHRPVATDKRAFFLISTTSSNMYELVCSTAEERNVWFHHITKAADDYKNRQETRRSENLQNSNSNSISSTTAATNIPSSLASSDVQGKDVGADGDGEKDSSGQLFPPMATPSVSKEPSPAPESTCSDPIQSPGSPEKSGDGSGRLQVQGTKVSRSASMGGRPKEGEFLQITQSSPLVDPSEVVVTSRDIQFAQAVLSPHEELRRADLQVQKALEEKLRIASKLFHIPPTPTLDDSSVNILCDSKDAKEVIVKCINNVDRLIGIVSNQKSTKEYSESNREQQIIHANLNKMLTHILSEFERKEEELELRRQELHRVREQNHGYQDRLQNLSVSSVASPSHSRPSSLITDHHSHDEEDAKTVPFPSKPLSSDLVATSNSEEESGATLICNPTLQSCDSAQNFADATSSESRLLKRDSDAEGGEVEKNRDCPETEVLIVTTAAEPQLEAYQDDSSSSSSKPAVTVPDDKPLQQQQENEDEKSNGDLLLVTTNGHNGESTSDSDQAEVKSAISSKKSDCNVLPENDSSTDLQGEAKETA
ncbi:uncharacterized protein LOC110844861 isoform X3 [Folsomia candida]|uniref:uncharacterized protein LOC110844861 isoform X3 n=1 Tax=Folsomia candida TaxID=158441 RepID=UPI000B8F73D3|nr:uncharacterized protein LOC110844861 isoform X3 [Folsomia candida]